MKRPHPIPLLVALLSLPLLAVAGADSDSLKARFLDEGDPEADEVRKLGEDAINRLATTLVREVTAAMAKEGPAGAVDACHLKAVPITHGTIAGLPRIVAMKRTSLKLRSPANAPDAAEKLVLDHIQQLLNDGDSPPPLLVQRIEPIDAAPEWRVYKPIGMMPKCLACHGDPEGQPDALRAKLAERYPTDQATGYNTGDWRGHIRVTVAHPPGK